MGLASQSGVRPKGLYIAQVVGDEGGDIAHTSSSFVDFDAAYTLDIPAGVGDRLLMTFESQVYNTNQYAWCGVIFNVDGSDIAEMSTNGIIRSLPMQTNGTDSVYCSWLYTVQAADIAAGLVTVKPRIKVSSGTFTFPNDGTFGTPIFRVVNLGIG